MHTVSWVGRVALVGFQHFIVLFLLIAGRMEESLLPGYLRVWVWTCRLKILQSTLTITKRLQRKHYCRVSEVFQVCPTVRGTLGWNQDMFLLFWDHLSTPTKSLRHRPERGRSDNLCSGSWLDKDKWRDRLIIRKYARNQVNTFAFPSVQV